MTFPAPLASPPLGVILAGGSASRFGGPKGLERVGGVRIIDRAASCLREISPELLLVANDPAADTWLPGVPRVADRIVGAGGLGGLHAALLHAHREVVVVAWDMPFVPADLLRALAEHRRRFTAFAAVPVTDAPTGMEPFCACYAAACGPALERVLHAGTHGAATFVRSLPRVSWLSRAAVEAFGDPARTFLSVNTREDLARAQSLLQPAG